MRRVISLICAAALIIGGLSLIIAFLDHGGRWGIPMTGGFLVTVGVFWIVEDLRADPKEPA